MSLRVAIVADYLEEGWASMDLVAEMLSDHLRREHGDSIMRHAHPADHAAPPRRMAARRRDKVSMIDRLVARQWDYPRALAGVDRAGSTSITSSITVRAPRARAAARADARHLS